MAENEIPNSYADQLSTALFYRVTIVRALTNRTPQQPQEVQVMDFKKGSLWDMKESALRYFTIKLSEALEAYYRAKKPKERLINSSLLLSLIKTGINGTEEEFILIGGTEEQMLDAKMEEEIAFAIQRTSKLY
jgi:hypothetical protein